MSTSAARLRRLRRGLSSPNRAVPIDRQREARREASKAADSVFARVALITEQDHVSRRPRWRRFPVAGAASGLAMFVLLLGFSFVLRPRVRAPAPSSAIVATLMEPLSKPAAPKKIAPAVPAKIAPSMKPRREVNRRPPPPKPRPRPVTPPPIPESATSSLGSIPVAPSKAPAPQPPPANSGPPAEAGAGEAGIGGSESGGARAIYAPLPKIPDELRENPFSTVAVAHFVVAPDGGVQVTLTTPTPDPRLNELILDTLHQWKFFPALKDGIAIASQFDVRIPISVQ